MGCWSRFPFMYSTPWPLERVVTKLCVWKPLLQASAWGWKRLHKALARPNGVALLSRVQKIWNYVGCMWPNGSQNSLKWSLGRVLAGEVFLCRSHSAINLSRLFSLADISLRSLFICLWQKREHFDVFSRIRRAHAAILNCDKWIKFAAIWVTIWSQFSKGT